MKKILFILLFSSSFTVFSQRKELKIAFNDSLIKSSKIISYSKTSTLLELKDELRKAINQLHQNAYLLAGIDSILIDSTHFSVFMNLGKQYKWSYLKTVGIDEEVLSKTGFRDKLFQNKPFNQNSLSVLLEEIIKHYENNGYPFSSLRFDSIQIENDIFKGNIILEKNKRFEIDSVLIVGNATLSSKYIQNYIRIKNNDLYNETNIRNISTRLKELPFVEENQPFKVIFSESGSKIILDLKKKKASRFNGILGILPNNETGKIRLTGDVKLNLLNSFKKGEEITFNWRSIQENTQDLKTGFVYPFVANSPFGIDYSFKLYKKDTSFIDVFNKIGARYILKGNNYFSVFYQNKKSALLSTNGFKTLTVLPDYADITTQLYGIGFTFNQLDYLLNPRRGYSVFIEGAAGSKSIKKNSALKESLYEKLKLNSSLYQATTILDFYFPVKKRSAIKLSNKSGFTINESLFDNELNRIGGIFTLRGFDEESINTTLYSIATVEYRFILEQNSYLYLFFDGSYVEKDNVKGYLSDRPYGFGSGMSFDTKAGIFSISYALGTQFDNPILFRNAKIHFGFVNFF
ncbi:MAG: hypothetical protein IT232_09965 [Flavobacteriales bacterium]|nr:hypothetical protein [Flavobacteriales bacterium]